MERKASCLLSFLGLEELLTKRHHKCGKSSNSCFKIISSEKQKAKVSHRNHCEFIQNRLGLILVSGVSMPILDTPKCLVCLVVDHLNCLMCLVVDVANQHHDRSPGIRC